MPMLLVFFERKDPKKLFYFSFVQHLVELNEWCEGNISYLPKAFIPILLPNI